MQPLQRKTENIEGTRGFCYTNPVMLSEENNRIYIFWRGADWKTNIGEQNNLYKIHPEKVEELTSALLRIISEDRSTSGEKQSNENMDNWPQMDEINTMILRTRKEY